MGTDATSMEELMERVNKAVTSGAVESVTITVGTQRRAVLEVGGVHKRMKLFTRLRVAVGNGSAWVGCEIPFY